MQGRARRGFWVLLAIVALLASGCEDESADAARRRSPGQAGKACQLLEYDAVAAALGTRFNTAGGAVAGETYSCAFTQAEHEFPDLTLSMTVSAADEVIFTATVTPSGTTPVPGLGRVAYRYPIAAVQAHGPGLEIGWLSGKGWLMMLRYNFAEGATPEDVEQLTPKLISLAQQIDGDLPAPVQ